MENLESPEFSFARIVGSELSQVSARKVPFSRMRRIMKASAEEIVRRTSAAIPISHATVALR
jgi:hypothetical protein